jgi:hypothetical protein
MFGKPANPLLIGFLAIVFAILGFVFIRNLIDFPVYYVAGQSLLRGRTDLYAADFALGKVMDYRYPPFFILTLIPLWLLPYKVAAYLWYLLSIFQIAGSIVFLKNLLTPSVITKRIWLLVFCAVGQYFIIILHYGNAHLLALFCLFASFYYALNKKDIRAALLMALAITIKLTPAFMLLYFILQKRWKYLTLVGAFLFVINISPAAYFGFEKNAQLLRTWYQHVVVNQEFHEMNGPINLSLKGQLKRYLSGVDYQQRVDGDTRYPAVTIATFSVEKIEKIWLFVSLVLVFLAAFLIYRKNQPETNSQNPETTDRDYHLVVKSGNRFNQKKLVEVGLLFSLMLFVEPLTSKIYFITLIWPFTVLAVAAFEKSTDENRWIRHVLLFIAILNFVLPLLPGRWTQRWLLVLGADFYVNLLLLVAQFYYLMALRKGSRSPNLELQTRVL